MGGQVREARAATFRQHGWFTRQAAVSLIALTVGVCLQAHTLVEEAAPAPIPEHDWILFPDYRLPGEDANYPGPRIPLPESLSAEIPASIPPIVYRGQNPTQRWLPEAEFPASPPFTIEMWTVDHSDKETGVSLFVRDLQANGSPLFNLAYFNNSVEAVFEDSRLLQGSAWRSAFNRYWRHAVLSVDSTGMATLYYNGSAVMTAPWYSGSEDVDPFVEIAAYTGQDALMRIENLLHRCRIYRQALERGEVQEAFSDLATAVYNGIIYPGMFHFTAGPAITYADPTGIYMSVEADRPTRISVRYGTDPADLDRTFTIPTLRKIHAVRLDNLEPGQVYHYRVTLEDSDGEQIDSGALSFRTPPLNPETVTFAVIGDTEARPWVNDAVAKRIWEHEAEFVVHMGDITDNGIKERKPQWTHEYFAGMTQLQSRIPVVAVPGNGEGGDLYWYKRYFLHPRDQGNAPGFFRFSYGSIDFFMLNSNAREDEFQPGGRQYVWLAEQLRASEATWTVVCFHHVGTPSTFGSDPEVNGLVPLFDEFAVDLVFNGHIHTYERSHPRRNGEISEGGTTYIVSGGAGGNLKDPEGSSKSHFASRVYRGHHYLIVEVDGPELTVSMHDLDGNRRDSVTVKKNRDDWTSIFKRAHPAAYEEWLEDPAFGWIYAACWPWSFHLNAAQSGWFFNSSAASLSDGFLQFDLDRQRWTYTGYTIFPYFFDYSTGAWDRYEPDMTGLSVTLGTRS
jgi:predicted phosphodiesterase